MIKLSIITPTFNRKEKLVFNLESVKNQTFKFIEHIIVDNMSSDGTDSLIAEYQKKASYPVIYIREADNGVYNAMNKGIIKSQGLWTHILNSDDCYSSSDVLQNLFSSQNIEDYDIIVNPILTGENGNSLWKPEFNEKINHYRFPHPGLLVKKCFYNKHGYYNEKYKIISDAIWGIKYFPLSRYMILEKPLVTMSDGGISSKISLKNIYEPVICTLFYHKYPIYYKIQRTLDYLSEPVNYFKKKYISAKITKIKKLIKKAIKYKGKDSN
jgi:glycosyltransferase involved in cell wall biosynthesis